MEKHTFVESNTRIYKAAIKPIMTCTLEMLEAVQINDEI